MKNIFVFLTALCLLNIPQVQAQIAGDYRSAASGTWQTASTWQTFNGSAWVAASQAPTSADGVITIRNGHTVPISSSSTVTTDQTVVESGGLLTLNFIINLNNGAGTDLTINSGGSFYWGSNGTTINGPGDIVNNGFMGWGVCYTGGNISSSLTTTLTNNGQIDLCNNQPGSVGTAEFRLAGGGSIINFGLYQNKPGLRKQSKQQ